MNELILVRHGRTEWNAAHRFQGRTDVPLSEEGVGQARAIAGALAGETFDSIYSSDLRRALQTAHTIAVGRNVDVRLDFRLREFDFGAWEGLTWAEILERFPDTNAAGGTSAGEYAPTGGETFDEVRARVRGFWNERLTGPAARNLVVTHAGILHAFIAELFGADIEAEGVRFAPGSITRIAFEGERPYLLVLDDVRHLA
jgi:broad specificity phosphatase PhoE